MTKKHRKDSVIDPAKMQGISKQTITIIASKFSRPKNKLVLADMYAIKQKAKVKQRYKQELNTFFDIYPKRCHGFKPTSQFV